MPPKNSFRFTVGTEVLCRTGRDEWSRGTIVALNYRKRDWPPGETVPYQVFVLGRGLIFVPADVPQVCKEFVAPLWEQAVAEQDVLKLKAAVSEGCEEADHLGRTPLLCCVGNGWQEGALLLLAQRADPCKSAGPEKCTALHLAVLPLARVACQGLDMEDSITFLREEGVINVKQEKNNSPGGDIDDDHVSSISYDEHGTLTWVTFPEEGPSSLTLPTSQRAWVPARLAALVQGTAVRTEGLPKTVSRVPFIQALLDARADVNGQNEDPDNDLDNFTSTTYSGSEQRQHRSALHYAAEADELGLCAALIAARATVDLEDRYKMTPLDLALEEGSQQSADALLRNAADPNRGNMRRGLQQTALHQMCDLGKTEFVKLLLKHGGKVNMAGKQGMTPLHFAARKKYVDVVKVLLESGADISLPDKSGRTPGQYAISNKNGVLAQALALADNLQLCDRIALLENALNGQSQQHMESEERQPMLKSLHAI